uniref:Uncharacterized protein n=1 Tax=Oryza sativa subsp. japonica TaxID=39947 RepID=Q6ATH3_ORYSJ|nr:hypothetical protein [Oryza sativa Japonica Group]
MELYMNNPCVLDNKLEQPWPQKPGGSCLDKCIQPLTTKIGCLRINSCMIRKEIQTPPNMHRTTCKLVLLASGRQYVRACTTSTDRDARESIMQLFIGECASASRSTRLTIGSSGHEPEANRFGSLELVAIRSSSSDGGAQVAIGRNDDGVQAVGQSNEGTPAGTVLNHRTERSGIHPKAEIDKAAEFRQRHAIATGNDRSGSISIKIIMQYPIPHKLKNLESSQVKYMSRCSITASTAIRIDLVYSHCSGCTLYPQSATAQHMSLVPTHETSIPIREVRLYGGRFMLNFMARSLIDRGRYHPNPPSAPVENSCLNFISPLTNHVINIMAMWRSCLHMPHLNYLPKAAAVDARGKEGGSPVAAAATTAAATVAHGGAGAVTRRHGNGGAGTAARRHGNNSAAARERRRGRTRASARRHGNGGSVARERRCSGEGRGEEGRGDDGTARRGAGLGARRRRHDGDRRRDGDGAARGSRATATRRRRRGLEARATARGAGLEGDRTRRRLGAAAAMGRRQATMATACGGSGRKAAMGRASGDRTSTATATAATRRAATARGAAEVYVEGAEHKSVAHVVCHVGGQTWSKDNWTEDDILNQVHGAKRVIFKFTDLSDITRQV